MVSILVGVAKYVERAILTNLDHTFDVSQMETELLPEGCGEQAHKHKCWSTRARDDEMTADATRTVQTATYRGAPSPSHFALPNAHFLDQGVPHFCSERLHRQLVRLEA